VKFTSKSKKIWNEQLFLNKEFNVKFFMTNKIKNNENNKKKELTNNRFKNFNG